MSNILKITTETASVSLKQPLYKKVSERNTGLVFPIPPPWRSFARAPDFDQGDARKSDESSWFERARHHQPTQEQCNAINLALHLHRPVLITGNPGTGKTSLAYSAAYKLGLAEPLVWAVTSRSTVTQALYQYDAIGRLQAKQLQNEGDTSELDVGKFLRLGPLGAALKASKPDKPCVLLIDEIDKGDVDLANDLLQAFEEGRFEIPELRRMSKDKISVGMPGDLPNEEVFQGQVQCKFFPLIVMTSNGEREFSAAFHRRCIRLHIEAPSSSELMKIISARLQIDDLEKYQSLVNNFVSARDGGGEQMLATDQLLNAVQLIERGELASSDPDEVFKQLVELGVLKNLVS